MESVSGVCGADDRVREQKHDNTDKHKTSFQNLTLQTMTIKSKQLFINIEDDRTGKTTLQKLLIDRAIRHL